MQSAGLTVTIPLRFTNWCRQLCAFTGTQTAVNGHVQFGYEIAEDTIFMSYKIRVAALVVTAVWTVCTFFLRKSDNFSILLKTH